MTDENRCSVMSTWCVPSVRSWLAAGIGGLAVLLCGSLAGEIFAQQIPVQIRVRAGLPGQPVIDGSEEQTTEGVFHGDRETRKQLKKAKKLLEDGRFSEALPLLDDILESSQDYFDSTQENQVARNGLKSEAQRLIGSQSAEGLKAYEMLFGAKAERMLADALAAGDMPAVAEVGRRYFHTRAGYDATLLLGRYQLDHNEPLAAALCFQRLQGTPAAEKYEPNLSVILAVCWLRGGIEPRAREVLLDLKKRDPGATIRIAGKDERVFAASDEAHALDWLVKNFGKAQAGGSVEAASWALNGGNAARNAMSAGSMPLLHSSWKAPPNPPNPAAEKALLSAQQDSFDRNQPEMPVAQPLAVADYVLMRTPAALYGVSFANGLLKWSAGPSLQRSAERNQSNMARANNMMFNGQDQSSFDKMWENATYSTLSSDGDFVFEVEEVPDISGAPPVQQRRIFRANGMAGGVTDNPTNELAAYDLHSQGKIVWKIGGESKKDHEVEPQLNGAFFLGPPLPLLGRLYVLAEIKGEIRLVVLDTKTGKMDWSQQLASPEDSNGLGSGFRRSTGVSPSYADGVMICPTSAGAIVAVDIANRSLLWGYEYPHQIQQQQIMAIRMGRVVNANNMQNFMGDRWSDATATIADGCVIVTPVESEELFCLSLIDGKLLWKMDRGENIYVAGMRDGKVLLVGRKQVQAYQLADGKPAWSEPLLLPQGSVPSGRGFLSDAQYFLPLSSAEVASIDVTKGKITARAKSRNGIIPGNLICYKGAVISQGAEFAYKFFQIEPLKRDAAAALAANPDDYEALSNRGNAELDEGKLPEAIADFRKSYELYCKLAPLKAASTRELLVEALLADLSHDFTSSKGTVAELEKLIVLDSERIDFLRMLSVGLGKSGDRLGAFDAYLKLIDMPGGQTEPEVVSSVLSVRRDRWVRARVEELYSSATSDERAKFDAAITERLNSALAIKEPGPLRKFLASFGFHPSADEAREQLFAQLTTKGNALERESLLDDLQRSADPVRARAAVAQMAMLLNECGKSDEAAYFYRRLKNEFPNVICLSGKTGKELAEGLPADSPVELALAQTAPWPEGNVRHETPAENRSMRAGQNNQRAFPLTWRGARPGFLDSVDVAFDQQQQQVIGRDGIGKERFRVGINEAPQNRLGFQPVSVDLNFASARGHLLLVNLGNQVLALDTLRSPAEGSKILWQQDLVEMTPNMFNGQPLQGKEIHLPWGAIRHVPASGNNGASLAVVGPLLDHCVVLQRSRDLTAIDPTTGDILWSRRGIEAGSEVFGDQEVLIIAPPDGVKDSDKAIVLRTRDGELLGTRHVPKAYQRWSYCGRRCLSGRTESDGKLTFTLSDPWKEQDLVLGTFEPGVKPALIGDDAAAFLEPRGKFLMVALADGRKLIDEQLEPESGLDNIVVQRTADQYLLFANRPMAQGGNGNQPIPQGVLGPDGGMSPTNGHLYAFDRGNGKPLWPVPALVENYHAVLNQGSDLPVLVLLRWRQLNSTANDNSGKSSLLCLDRRSGRAVWEEEIQAVNGQPLNFLNCEVSGNPKQHTVSLIMPTQSLMLRFTNDPVPPEPPYQAGLLIKQTNAAAAALKAILPGLRDSEGGSSDDPLR